MTAWLISEVEGKTKQYVCETVLTFGRDSHSDISLDDPMASRNHAVLRQLGGNKYFLTDMGSTNGTFLNDRRISEPTQVRSGDAIRIGSSKFEFVKDEDAAITSMDVPDKTIVARDIRVAEITILVSDIRNYTHLSESIPIQKLTQVIGQWLRAVSYCVTQHGGTVDKFIGDCVYARWESLGDARQSVLNALKTAAALADICEKLNLEYSDLPSPIAIGVGINTGSAAVDFSQENTAIGDAVNIAFRLESATKELGKDVVLSETSYRYLPVNIVGNSSQAIMVKGKQEPIVVSALDFSELQEFITKATAEN